MDPLLNIFVDVLPLILQHLSVRDTLRSSLVSPSWNAIIGESSTFMKKICLRFYYPIDDVNALSKSVRKYQSCKIQETIPQALIPIFDEINWKQVMIRDIPVSDHTKLLLILKQVAPSIEELDLWEIKSSSSSDGENFPQSILFPKLQRLEMNLCKGSIFSVFAKHNPQLRDVKLTRNFIFHPNLLSLIPHIEFTNQFFESNNQIEKLHIDGFNEIFLKPIHHGVTNVKQFTFSARFLDLTESINLIKFVQQQVNIRKIIILERFDDIFLDGKIQFLTDLLRASKLRSITLGDELWTIP